MSTDCPKPQHRPAKIIHQFNRVIHQYGHGAPCPNKLAIIRIKFNTLLPEKKPVLHVPDFDFDNDFDFDWQCDRSIQRASGPWARPVFLCVFVPL
jgi:hypothetical protein